MLALTAVALTMAEDSANESAERKDVMRTARCEHHDHDEKPPSKWLAKFKKTKHYGPSKSQSHRQKTHYGQPQAHIRPPPQYVRTQTNYNIPSFHPPAIPPPTSYPHLQNPNNVLPQHSYSPVKIYSSPPQVQSFNHPAHLPLAPTEAPPYTQDPEDVEGYSLLALVHNPLVPHSQQVPVSPVNLYGYPSQEQNFNRPAQQHSVLVSTEAPILSTYYSNAPSHQDLGDPADYSSPTPVNNHPPVPLSSVTITHGYPSHSQAQNFNLPPDSSTEAPVPSTHSNTPYRQDPVAPEIPTVPVNNPSASYSPSQVPVSPASYVPPSPNHLEIPDPDPPAITPPVSTEATVNQTSYNHPYSLPTTTPNSQDPAKTEKVPYPSRRPSRLPSKAPTYAPSSPVTTERTAYTSPSDSDFENPPVSSTPAFYPSPATTSYDPSTYSPPVTEAPAYFPPYFGDDFDAHSFDDPDPEPEPLGKPTFFPSYDDSPFSYNNPSFFEESQNNVSPPVYSEEPFRKANSRPSSAEIPDYYSNEDEKDDAWKDDEEEEFFQQQQGKFPRFDEFVKQMMSIGRK